MKGSRRLSRELALQGLYLWLVNRTETEEILAQLADKDEFAKADRTYLETLLRGVIDNNDALSEKVGNSIDRPIGQLSPIEHALLLMAASELMSQPDIPYRVVINEAVELAKSYGGTDGHKYVNGVLDKLATELRPREIASRTREA